MPPQNTDRPPLRDLDNLAIEVISELEPLHVVCAKLSTYKGAIAVDTETTGDHPHRDQIKLLQVAAMGFPIYVFQLAQLLSLDREGVVKALNQVFGRERLIIMQQGLFELVMLGGVGMRMRGPFFDTLLAARVLECGKSTPCGLGDLSRTYLGIELDKSLQQSFIGQAEEDAVDEQQIRYGAKDAAVTLMLYAPISTKLRIYRAQRIPALEFQLLPTVARMELVGVPIGAAQLEAHCQQVREAQQVARGEVARLLSPQERAIGLFGGTADANVSLEDRKELLRLLQERGLKVEGTTTDKLIEHVEQPVIQHLLTYRRHKKEREALSKLTEAMEQGRVRVRYNQLNRESGCLELKGGMTTLLGEAQTLLPFICPPDGRCLIWTTFPTLDLQVLAAFSNDQRLLEEMGLCREERDGNAPSLVVARGLGIHRLSGKALQLYAYSTQGLLLTGKEAKQLSKQLTERYAGVAGYHESVKSSIWFKPALTGRTRRWEQHPPTLRDRTAYPILATVSDLLKMCMVTIAVSLPEDSQIVGCWGRGILVECPADQSQALGSEIAQAMRNTSRSVLSTTAVARQQRLIGG